MSMAELGESCSELNAGIEAWLLMFEPCARWPGGNREAACWNRGAGMRPELLKSMAGLLNGVGVSRKSWSSLSVILGLREGVRKKFKEGFFAGEGIIFL